MTITYLMLGQLRTRVQITSLFLHWMPACVVWTLRWYPHRSTRLNFDAKSDEAKARWHHGSLLDLVLLPFLPYLLWAVAYYIKVAYDDLRTAPRVPSLAPKPISYLDLLFSVITLPMSGVRAVGHTTASLCCEPPQLMVVSFI